MLFLFKPWVLGSEKSFHTAPDLCRNTPRTHCSHKEEEYEPVCFSLRLKTAGTLQSHEKCCFCHYSTNLMLTSIVKKLCKRAQEFSVTSSMGSVLRIQWGVLRWVFSATPIVSLILWNWTGWRLPSKTWQAACSFQKTQVMAKSCPTAYCREKWPNVFSWLI